MKQSDHIDFINVTNGLLGLLRYHADIGEITILEEIDTTQNKIRAIIGNARRVRETVYSEVCNFRVDDYFDGTYSYAAMHWKKEVLIVKYRINQRKQ